MTIFNELNDAFFSGQRNEKIKFVINDTVLVISGKYKGKECVVISINSLNPEVSYTLEQLDGSGDIMIFQKEIELQVPSELSRK